MSGLLSRAPSPIAVRLAVGGLMFGHVQALIFLSAPSSIQNSPRSLIIVLSLLSFGSFVAAITGIGSTDPQERWRSPSHEA